jgi:hypothetical protein
MKFEKCHLLVNKMRVLVEFHERSKLFYRRARGIVRLQSCKRVPPAGLLRKKISTRLRRGPTVVRNRFRFGLLKKHGGSYLPPLAWFGGFMDLMRKVRLEVTRKDVETLKGLNRMREHAGQFEKIADAFRQ